MHLQSRLLVCQATASSSEEKKVVPSGSTPRCGAAGKSSSNGRGRRGGSSSGGPIGAGPAETICDDDPTGAVRLMLDDLQTGSGRDGDGDGGAVEADGVAGHVGGRDADVQSEPPPPRRVRFERT